MLREKFDSELAELRASLLAMGSEVEENIIRATDALLNRNAILSQRIIDADKNINDRRISIVMDSLVLIATQQPMAGDMRLIATMIEIAGELERMHDYLKGIGRTSLEIGDDELLPSFTSELPRMARMAKDMLRRSMLAFSDRNEILARSIPTSDDFVDELFNKMYADIVRFASSNPDRIAHANQLEWVIHNMERTADRVINICEWIVYMITGVYQEFDSEYESPPLI